MLPLSTWFQLAEFNIFQLNAAHAPSELLQTILELLNALLASSTLSHPPPEILCARLALRTNTPWKGLLLALTDLNAMKTTLIPFILLVVMTKPEIRLGTSKSPSSVIPPTTDCPKLSPDYLALVAIPVLSETEPIANFVLPELSLQSMLIHANLVLQEVTPRK